MAKYYYTAYDNWLEILFIFIAIFTGYQINLILHGQTLGTRIGIIFIVVSFEFFFLNYVLVKFRSDSVNSTMTQKAPIGEILHHLKCLRCFSTDDLSIYQHVETFTSWENLGLTFKVTNKYYSVKVPICSDCYKLYKNWSRFLQIGLMAFFISFILILGFIIIGYGDMIADNNINSYFVVFALIIWAFIIYIPLNYIIIKYTKNSDKNLRNYIVTTPEGSTIIIPGGVEEAIHFEDWIKKILSDL